MELGKHVVCLYGDVCAGVSQETLTVCMLPNGQILQQQTIVCCSDTLSAYKRSPLNPKSTVLGSVNEGRPYYVCISTIWVFLSCTINVYVLTLLKFIIKVFTLNLSVPTGGWA